MATATRYHGFLEDARQGRCEHRNHYHWTGLPGDQPQGGGTTTVQTPDQPRTKCVLVEFVSEDDHVVMLTALPSTGRMHQYTPQGPGEPMSAGTTITDRRNRVYYVCPFNFDGDADWAVTAERR